MAAITAGMVKELRDKTGAGMMDCKAALSATDGNMEAAIDWLRAKGLSKAAKKAGRVAAEGLVAVAVRGHSGVVVEVNSETDLSPATLNSRPSPAPSPMSRSSAAATSRRWPAITIRAAAPSPTRSPTPSPPSART